MRTKLVHESNHGRAPKQKRTKHTHQRHAVFLLFLVVLCIVLNMRMVDQNELQAFQSQPIRQQQQQQQQQQEQQQQAGYAQNTNANETRRAYFPSRKASTRAAKGLPQPRIAILGSFVSFQKHDGTFTRIKNKKWVLNKACYAYIWGYDYIFNATDSFSAEDKNQSEWLTFGHWNRVPHLQAVIDDYDWVFYADLDLVIRDMSRPLSSFLHEFRLYNQTPSVFVPNDSKFPDFSFSTYAMLIKNDDFGHRLLENWMKFARGLCPNGNFKLSRSEDGKPVYFWPYSDQPGLWYATVQTYEDFYKTGKMKRHCNELGYVDSSLQSSYRDEINAYFQQVGVVHGHYGDPLSQMQNNQPIIWSSHKLTEPSHDRGGLGLQVNFPPGADKEMWSHAFAMHNHHAMPGDFDREINYCKKHLGCYARYNRFDRLEIGCGDKKFTVVQ